MRRQSEEHDANHSGVYLVNGSPYGRYQNGYLIHNGAATVLVDSGDLRDDVTLPEVERNAARWGFEIGQVSHLFITHAHHDHASHAAALQRRGLKLVATPATAEAMAAGDTRCIGFTAHRKFEPCQIDVELHDGEELDVNGLRVRCLAAPGHSQRLAVVELKLAGARLWVTGDLFEALTAHTSVNLPFNGSPDFDRATYIASVARLVDMAPLRPPVPRPRPRRHRLRPSPGGNGLPRGVGALAVGARRQAPAKTGEH
jgi:glyoxylase-like metal-dependent hydrolase (beta-lactamase superfamily II)